MRGKTVRVKVRVMIRVEVVIMVGIRFMAWVRIFWVRNEGGVSSWRGGTVRRQPSKERSLRAPCAVTASPWRRYWATAVPRDRPEAGSKTERNSKAWDYIKKRQLFRRVKS